MSYSKSVVAKTRQEFSKKRISAQKLSDDKKTKLYTEIDGLKEIDVTLSTTLSSLAIEIAKGSGNINERIEAIKNKNIALQKKREELLISHGYPADYTDIKYECTKCNDTGYIGVEMCDCLKKALSHNTILESGIGHLVDSQSFETFDLSYYSFNSTVSEGMSDIYSRAKKYAEQFTVDSGNLLFIGQTGLGKTHLSTSIAKSVIEKGYNVCYETMQNIISDFEYERFGRGYNSDNGHYKTDKYFECDFLIIDDLGTEIVNNFTISCLYNLLNTRINSHKPMLINTNLVSKEFREKYDDRLTSRVLGGFDIYMFSGQDIRQLKLANKK